MSKEKPLGAEKRRHPRIRIELPAHAHLDNTNTTTVRLVDISAQGMQLKMKTSDFEALRKLSDKKDQTNCFEVRITARLAWVSPDTNEIFKTGWEFNLLDGEERIG